MLEKAMRLSDAHYGSLGTWQDKSFSWVAIRGVSPALLDYVGQNRTGNLPGLP
jgi:hypothetical protein